MKIEKFFLSTIATDAVRVAREHGFGLEIAEYCTAWNMDEKFVPVDGVVKKKLEGICASLLHAPYGLLENRGQERCVFGGQRYGVGSKRLVPN